MEVFIIDAKQTAHQLKHNNIAVLNLDNVIHASMHLWFSLLSTRIGCGHCYGKGHLCREA